MVVRQARLWLMTETAANQTAQNFNNGSRPQHINTPEREKGRNVPDGLVQQGTCQDADDDRDDDSRLAQLADWRRCCQRRSLLSWLLASRLAVESASVLCGPRLVRTDTWLLCPEPNSGATRRRQPYRPHPLISSMAA
jgi:hypothetical protein